jgi:hypothetical protein
LPYVELMSFALSYYFEIISYSTYQNAPRPGPPHLLTNDLHVDLVKRAKNILDELSLHRPERVFDLLVGLKIVTLYKKKFSIAPLWFEMRSFWDKN